jgi:class 3 adenylate cyclase
VEPLTIGIGIVLLVGMGVAGYLLGVRRTPTDRDDSIQIERGLEEYEFYPFVVNQDGHVEFSADAFDEAVVFFLEERNERAGQELVVIGQQNLVRDTFPSDRLGRYEQLYRLYDGDGVVSDNDAFLENYKRIVHQLGRSFPNTGIEVLLHNLVNPSTSLVAIENGEVTGRSVGSGATNLVLDLKTRRQRGEDKVNYELNIGPRQFKCTTIPIFRENLGLVGAFCVNIDTHFIRETAATEDGRLEAFIDNLLRTEFDLDENILSKTEYQNALKGKTHFLDDAIRTQRSSAPQRKLAAILFSDIVSFTALMGSDETATLEIVDANTAIHRRSIAKHRGHLIKELGDGILASFDSVSESVACATAIQEAVTTDGRFRIRIGIHLGAVVEVDGDVRGDAVNIASRIQEEMNPGEIGLSAVVYENVRNLPGISATERGKRSLKNVTIPVTVYSLDI